MIRLSEKIGSVTESFTELQIKLNQSELIFAQFKENSHIIRLQIYLSIHSFKAKVLLSIIYQKISQHNLENVCIKLPITFNKFQWKLYKFAIFS